ncbi:unnamed protein product, partial [Closterium sp. NIES-53]
MASLRVLAFDHEGRPLQFDTWLDDLQLYLLSDSRDSVPLFDHTSGAAPAPPAIADSATRSQWLTRDAAARLAIRNHLPLAECAHFGQHRTAQTLYDAVVARYSSPATAALGGLLLPYLFPELSTFATVEDLVSHLRTSNARYRAAAPTEFLDRNQPPMFTTLYFIVTRLPDSLRFVRDHFLSLDPTSLTVDLLEQHLLAAETSAVATSLVLRMSGLLLPVRSAAAARARVAGVVEGAAGVVVGAAVEAVEVVAAVGVVEGVGTLVVAVEAAVGVAVVAAVAVVGVGLELSVEILEEASGSGNSVGARPLRPCSFRPYWAELLRSGVAIFDLDYDAILSAMYALSTSAEGDCYRFLLCMLCLRQLCEWLVRRARLRSGAPGAGAAGAGGAGVTAGAGSNGGTAIAGPGGARTRGTGAAGTGGVRGAGAGDPTEPGVAGAGSSGAGGVGAGGAGGGGTDAGAAGAGGIGAGGARAGGAVAVDTGGTMRPRPYFVPLLQQSQLPLQPASPLPAPSPYTAQSGGLIEHCEPASHPASLVRTARRVPRSRPPPVPGTHTMTLRPSSVLLRVPLPAPPESSLPQVPDPKSDRARAASPTVSRLLATAVTDPSFESGAASALVGELLDFAAACPLDYATALVAESEFASPTSVGGECALGTVVLEDRQEDFECLAAAVPRFASMLLAHEGDPDAPDIPTPRSYVEASTGPYSSQWQAAMDAEMASWKSTGTYIDEGVDYFQTFSRTLKMTTLQRDYELHSLDFSTAFLQGSLHEEIWLRRPPGFTGPFSAGTQWSLRRLVLQRFGFQFSFPQPTPLSTGHSFSALPSDKSVEPSGPYPNLVGCLMYLMTCTRSDLAYPLSLLARYMAPGRHRKRAAPHSSEFPPTEAPLQTLHMDVWGPARVRGQGHERYFLLVVDDYSRYTTVFPLRSKGEVSEVLIDSIRAARLRLRESFGSDFPVLRLHSDRGGEFSSALLGAFCRAQGIRQTFTLPASPQQNGIVERRIGMVMDVARTSMIHAAAPHFLWPFAVQYAAHQLNLQPRVSLPQTSPTLLWTGKVGDASAFRVWGSRVFVRDLSADKLSPRAVPCVFLGFPLDAPGWQFYHPTSRRVLSSQDVTFDESVPYYRLFPYRTASLPPPPLFLAPGPPPVDPLPPQGPAPAEPAGAGSGGAESGGAETGGAEPEGAEPG